MDCTKCGKGTCMRITKQNKAKIRERRGFLVWLVTLPLRILRWIFRFGVMNESETYHKETFWRCNYCGHKFNDDPWEKQATAAETAN